MSVILKAAVTIIIGSMVTVAYGQSSLNAENLLFSQPKDFKVGFQANRNNNLLTELVPSSETVENWTQMITVQIFRGAAIEPAAFLQGVGKQYVDACPGATIKGKGIYTGKVNGYVVSMLALMCPNNYMTGKPETTVFRVIKGKDALYSIQRAWRSVPSDQDMNEVMQALSKVTVCDTRTSEHPCPSFDSLVSDKIAH